ncbi:hypothetical protein AB1L88_06160 [Tautonia sp. JC769]|uniref:DUF6968 family protein n=1 Tax=Tautonia sp. JC769 TaxID=3232135 RepID=UPI00345AABCA
MPIRDPMGPIIATRPMLWRNEDGVDVPALVEIGLPFEDPADPAAREGWWYCRLRITGLGDDQIHTFEDVDSVGALCAALTMAGTFVSIAPGSAGLDWAMLPNWGFPVMPTPDVGGAGGAGAGNPVVES